MPAPQSILVLDDEPNFCRILEAKLTKASFDVVIAPDARTAFRHLLARRFDLVLLDLRLSDADGLEILPRIRAVAPATPVLVMTAYEVEGLRDRVLRMGAVDILYKPFDLNVLTASVQRVIANGPRPSRTASLISETLSAGRAVVIQVLNSPDSSPHTATVLDEKVETFAVATSGPVDADPGAPVLVSITGSDGLYEFRSKVVSQTAPATVSLVKPAVIHRNQRRKHPRRSFQRPVELRHTSEAGGAESAERTDGMTIDLSQGGLCVAIPSPLATGTRVSVSFTASDGNPRPFRAEATVVRADIVAGGAFPIHRVALQFQDVPAPYRPVLRALTEATPQI